METHNHGKIPGYLGKNFRRCLTGATSWFNRNSCQKLWPISYDAIDPSKGSAL